jgi:alpha-beta hydrolase superfamily lysophospholipase
MSASRLILSVLVAAVIAVSGCASFDTWQRRAIFQPAPIPEDAAYHAPAGADEFDLQVGNGHTVHGWYLRNERDDAPTLLFLHGARRNLYGVQGRIERWRNMGFHVLAIDYRGFGRSTNLLPSADSTIEDTRAAFAEFVRREPDPARRYVYGYSLGGALAIDLASREDGLAGVILESTFTSIGDVVQRSKWGWVPGLSLLVTQEFNSIGRMAEVNEPLLIIHGTEDRIIPHEMADELAAAVGRLTQPLRRVLKIDGASHWGIPTVAGASYDQAVRDFVSVVASAAPSAALASTPVAAH